MWRDDLEIATQYYLLANYYHGKDQKRYERYTHAFDHHMKRYARAYERSDTQELPAPSQVKRTRIRLLHAAIAAADQPVDVYIDGKYIATITYLTPNPYITIASGKHKITLYPAKKKTTPILETEIRLERGKRYLLAVADKSKQPSDGIRIYRYEETGSVPTNKAKLRFIHLSPNTPALDLEDRQKGISFRNVTYKENTPYEILEPGRVNVRVTVASSGNRIASIAFDARPNHAYTLLAAGDAQSPYWMLLLDR